MVQIGSCQSASIEWAGDYSGTVTLRGLATGASECLGPYEVGSVEVPAVGAKYFIVPNDGSSDFDSQNCDCTNCYYASVNRGAGVSTVVSLGYGANVDPPSYGLDFHCEEDGSDVMCLPSNCETSNVNTCYGGGTLSFLDESRKGDTSVIV